jgi:ABC-type amino acid transport system permease subunit
MSHTIVGLISFVAIFGGVIAGMLVARRLPGHHLSSETQSAVTVSVAVIGTLSALVLGLMISAANRSFSARWDDVRELSVQLIRIDRNLHRYGPEADDARLALHAWGKAKTQQLFPEKGQARPSTGATIIMLESVQDEILDLEPKNPAQNYLRTLCLTLTSAIIQAGWSLETLTGHSIPAPFLILLVFWLSIVFASFGLFAPPNPTTIIMLLLCSVAVSGGIYFIEELDNPVSGLIQISPDAMRKAVNEIGN